MSKVGVFSGVFDPVHKGHIGLALAAIQKLGLDEVYFLIEAKPRRKVGVTHLGHRTAMLKLATEAHPNLKVLELPDLKFTVSKTLPRLKQRFANDEIFLLVGSDMLEHMPTWPLINRLLDEVNLTVATRHTTSQTQAKNLASKLTIKPSRIYIITSPEPDLSSGQIRRALLNGQIHNGLLPSTKTYIKQNWLYVSPSSSNSSS